MTRITRPERSEAAGPLWREVNARRARRALRAWAAGTAAAAAGAVAAALLAAHFFARLAAGAL